MKKILAFAGLALLATTFGGCSGGSASGMLPAVQSQAPQSADTIGGGPLHMDNLGGGPLHKDNLGGGPLHKDNLGGGPLHKDNLGGGPLHQGGGQAGT